MSDDFLSQFDRLKPARRRFGAGAFLFHAGDPAETLHVIQSGAVRLVRFQADGQTAVLQRASPGDILAEASVFSPRYHCDALATSETETAAYPITNIRRLLGTDNQFCRAWAARMSHQLQAARRRAETVSLRTVAQRLDAWLAWNDDKMPGKGEWKAVAEEISVSPEALYRELAARRRC